MKAQKREKPSAREWPKINEILTSARRYHSIYRSFPGYTDATKHAPSLGFNWNDLNYRVQQIMGKDIAGCLSKDKFSVQSATLKEFEMLQKGEISALKEPDEPIPPPIKRPEPDAAPEIKIPKPRKPRRRTTKKAPAAPRATVTPKVFSAAQEPAIAPSEPSSDEPSSNEAPSNNAAPPKPRRRKKQKNVYESITKEDVLDTIRAYVRDERQPPKPNSGKIILEPLAGKNLTWSKLATAITKGNIQGFSEGTKLSDITRKMGLITARGRPATTETHCKHIFNALAHFTKKHKRLPSLVEDEQIAIGLTTKDLKLAFQRGLVKGWASFVPDGTEQPACLSDFLVAAGFADMDEDMNLHMAQNPPKAIHLTV